MEIKNYSKLILIDNTLIQNITFDDFLFSIFDYNKLILVYPINLNTILDSQNLQLTFENKINKEDFSTISLINLENKNTDEFIFDKDNLDGSSNKISGKVALSKPYENQYLNISIINQCLDIYIENDVYIKNTYLYLIDEINNTYFCYENSYSQTFIITLHRELNTSLFSDPYLKLIDVSNGKEIDTKINLKDLGDKNFSFEIRAYDIEIGKYKIYLRGINKSNEEDIQLSEISDFEIYFVEYEIQIKENTENYLMINGMKLENIEIKLEKEIIIEQINNIILKLQNGSEIEMSNYSLIYNGEILIVDTSDINFDKIGTYNFTVNDIQKNQNSVNFYVITKNIFSLSNNIFFINDKLNQIELNINLLTDNFQTINNLELNATNFRNRFYIKENNEISKLNCPLNKVSTPNIKCYYDILNKHIGNKIYIYYSNFGTNFGNEIELYIFYYSIENFCQQIISSSSFSNIIIKIYSFQNSENEFSLTFKVNDTQTDYSYDNTNFVYKINYTPDNISTDSKIKLIIFNNSKEIFNENVIYLLNDLIILTTSSTLINNKNNEVINISFSNNFLFDNEVTSIYLINSQKKKLIPNKVNLLSNKAMSLNFDLFDYEFNFSNDNEKIFNLYYISYCGNEISLNTQITIDKSIPVFNIEKTIYFNQLVNNEYPYVNITIKMKNYNVSNVYLYYNKNSNSNNIRIQTVNYETNSYYLITNELGYYTFKYSLGNHNDISSLSYNVYIIENITEIFYNYSLDNINECYYYKQNNDFSISLKSYNRINYNNIDVKFLNINNNNLYTFEKSTNNLYIFSYNEGEFLKDSIMNIIITENDIIIYQELQNITFVDLITPSYIIDGYLEFTFLLSSNINKCYFSFNYFLFRTIKNDAQITDQFFEINCVNNECFQTYTNDRFYNFGFQVMEYNSITISNIFSSVEFSTEKNILFCEKYGNFITDNNNKRSYQICLNSDKYYLGLIDLIQVLNNDDDEVIQYENALSLINDYRKYKFTFNNQTNKIYINIVHKSNKKVYSIKKIIDNNNNEEEIYNLEINIPLFINAISDKVLNYYLDYTVYIEFNIELNHQYKIDLIELYYTHFNGKNVTIASFNNNTFTIKENIIYINIKSQSINLSKNYFRFKSISNDIFDYDTENYLIIDNNEISLIENYMKVKKNSNPNWITIPFNKRIYQGKFESVKYENEKSLIYYFPSDNYSIIMINTEENNIKFNEIGTKTISIINYLNNSIIYKYEIIIESEPKIIINSKLNLINIDSNYKPITQISFNDAEIKKIFSNVNGNFTLLNKDNKTGNYMYIPKDNNEIVTLYYIDNSNRINEYYSEKIIYFSDIHYILDFNFENCLSNYDEYYELKIDIADRYKNILKMDDFIFKFDSKDLEYDNKNKILNITINEKNNNIFQIYLKHKNTLIYYEKITITNIDKQILNCSFYNSSSKTGKLIFKNSKCLLNSSKFKINSDDNSDIPISCSLNSTENILYCEYDTYHLNEKYNSKNIFTTKYYLLYNNKEIDYFYLCKKLTETKFNISIPAYNYIGNNIVNITSNEYNMSFINKVNYTNGYKNVSEKFISVENNSLSLSIILDKYNTEYSIISFNNVFGEYIFFDKNDYIIKVNEPKFNIEEEIFLIEKNSNSKEISFTINFNNSNDLELFKNAIYIGENKCDQTNNNIFKCNITEDNPDNVTLKVENINNNSINYLKIIPFGYYNIKNPPIKCFIYPFINSDFTEITINVETNLDLKELYLNFSNFILISNSSSNNNKYIYSFTISNNYIFSYGISYIKINNFPLPNQEYNFIKRLKSTVNEIEVYSNIYNQYIKLSFTEKENLKTIYIDDKAYNTKYNNEFIIEKVNFESKKDVYYIDECNNKTSIDNLILKKSDTTPDYKISYLSNTKLSNSQTGENRKIEVTFSNDIDILNDFSVVLIDRFNSSRNFTLDSELISYKGESNRKNLKFYFKNNCTNETCGKYFIYTNGVLCPNIFSFYSEMILKEDSGTYYINSNLKNIMIPFKEDVILSKSFISKVTFYDSKNEINITDYFFNYIELKDTNGNLIKYEVIQLNYDFDFTVNNASYTISIYDDNEQKKLTYTINIQNANFEIRVSKQFTFYDNVTIMRLYDEKVNLITLYFDEEIDLNYIDKVIYLDQELVYVKTELFREYYFKFKNELANNKTFPSIQDRIYIIMKNNFIISSKNELIVINNLNRPNKVMNDPIYIMNNSTNLTITFNQKIYKKYLNESDQYLKVKLNQIEISPKHLSIDSYNNLVINNLSSYEILDNDILIFSFLSDEYDLNDNIKAKIKYFSCQNSFVKTYHNTSTFIYSFSCQKCKDISPNLPYFSNYKCISSCNEISYNETCYSSCSSNNLKNLNLKEYNKTCVKKCPPLYGILSFNDNKCILCSSLGKNFLEINGICSNNCPIETINYNNECIFPEILNINENTVSCNNYCYNNGKCYFENSSPKCICQEGFIGTLCEIYIDLIDIYFNNSIEIFEPLRINFGERENKTIFNLNNITFLSKVKLINVLIKYKNELFNEKIMENYIANYILKSINITKYIYVDNESYYDNEYNIDNYTFTKMKSKGMYELIGIVFKILMRKYELIQSSNLRFLQNENNEIENLDIDNMNITQIQSYKKYYLKILKEISYSLNKYEIEYDLIDIKKCYVLYDSFNQLFTLKMFNTKNSILECYNYAIKNNIAFGNISSCNNSNFNDNGNYSYLITYINSSFSKIDNLNTSIIMIDALEKYYPYEFNNNILLNYCNYLNISLPFYQINAINYDLYDIYKKRGINIYDINDKAFVEKCYRNENFKFDLTQRYRKENIFQNYSFNGHINNCTFHSLDNRMINLHCPYRENGMGYSLIEKNINNYKTNFLIFKCANKVKDLSNNIAFWLFLTINFFVISIVIYFNIIFLYKYNMPEENNKSHEERNEKEKNEDVIANENNEERKENENNEDVIANENNEERNENENNEDVIANENNEERNENENNEDVIANENNEEANESNQNININERKYNIKNNERNKFNFSFMKSYIENLRQLHPLLSICSESNIIPFYMKIIILGINILNIFGFNSILTKEKTYIENRIFNKNRNKIYYPLIHEYKKLFLSITFTFCFCLLIKLIVIDISECKAILNESKKLEEIKNNNKKILLRRIISIILIVIVDCFMFFYCVVFCYIYINSQLSWFYSGCICLLIIWIIIVPFFALIFTLFNLKYGDNCIFFIKQYFFF